MLKQENRLKLDKDIKTLFARGRSVFDIGLGMRFSKNTLDHSRFTVVVGTKISKSAVKRNQIKRKVRDILEKRISKIKPGFDVMFSAKKEALEQTYEQLSAQVDNMLKRGKLV